MKNIALFFAFLASFPFLTSAQLTLENVKTGRMKVLSECQEAQIVYYQAEHSNPVPFDKIAYKGKIKQLIGDSIEFSLESAEWNAADLSNQQVQQIPAINAKLANTQAMLPLKGIESIVVKNGNINGFKGLAFIIASLAVVNSLAITPHIEEKNRGKFEKINAITVGVSLGIMFIPAKRHYQLGGNNQGGKSVWRVKS